VNFESDIPAFASPFSVITVMLRGLTAASGRLVSKANGLSGSSSRNLAMSAVAAGQKKHGPG